MKEPINFGWEQYSIDVPRTAIEGILFHKGRMLLLDYAGISCGDAFGEFTVPAENCEGHEPVFGMSVMRGVEIPEMAFQLLGVIIGTNSKLAHMLKEKILVAREIVGAKFNGFIRPGDKLVLTTKATDIEVKESGGVVIIKSGTIIARVGDDQKCVIAKVVIAGFNL